MEEHGKTGSEIKWGPERKVVNAEPGLFQRGTQPPLGHQRNPSGKQTPKEY